jgi:centrosomal protein CEP104
MDNKFQKLKYRLIEATTEDPDYPLYELMMGTDSTGWASVRFCTYPQEIFLQFLTPVHLKRIHLLSNEKKIASMVEIYCYYPSNSSNSHPNYKTLPFDKLGYVRMDTNSKTNYKAREFRKIFVDTYCFYLKIVLNKNYVNKYNVFNQVGLVSLDFYGFPVSLSISINNLYPKETNNNSLNEEELDEISMEKLKILKGQQEEALKVEDFDEAKRLKNSIDKIRLIGKKIFEMEVQKKIYITCEDFDNAKIMKFEIERLRSNLKYIDKQLPSIVPNQNISMELNRSSEGLENIDENEKLNSSDPQVRINEGGDKEEVGEQILATSGVASKSRVPSGIRFASGSRVVSGTTARANEKIEIAESVDKESIDKEQKDKES